MNARIVTADGEASALRFDERILDIDGPPRYRDVVVDLDGAFVFPGLINAHDHLEWNHCGRMKFRWRYANASEWLEEIGPRLRDDSRTATEAPASLADRVFIGGLKNLLAGVTTVAHHNPFYDELKRHCPIRVVERYGWAHSFALQEAPVGAHGETGGPIVERHRKTPRDAPFFIHVAEGLDPDARGELAWLNDAGCLTANTVLIHGVGMDASDWQRALQAGAALVWCPSSNLYLFERTAPLGRFLEAAGHRRARIALGTDSRLSGRRDLLEELDAAAGTEAVSPDQLLRMVTSDAADVIRQPAGQLRPGARADLVVLPALAEDPARALVGATRRDIGLVVIDGRPRLGDEAYARVFAARRIVARPLIVDEAGKLADAALAKRIEACRLAEPGVQLAATVTV